MSKQSDAKASQGYVAKPIPKTCANCKHLKMEVEEYKDWMLRIYTKEKNIRCGIGGFAVKKTATCNLIELVEIEREISK